MSGEGNPSGGTGRMTAAQMLLALTGAATLANGALLYGDGDATLATLSPGTNGHVLTLAGGVPTWAANGGAALPSSYAVGDILYASGASTLAKLAAVATGSVLASAGVTTAPAWSSSIALTGTVASKQSSAAGIRLDHNSATGNFTMSLSPGNLTADRRATFPDATGTVALLDLAQTFTGAQVFAGTPTAEHPTQPEWFLTATGSSKTWSVRYRAGSTQFSLTEIGVAEWFTITNGTGAVAFAGALSCGATTVTGALTVNSGNVLLNNGTASTSTGTGTLQVTGGAGFSGAGHFGGILVAEGKVRCGAISGYGIVSLNNDISSVAGVVGMYGAGAGDNALYLNAPTGNSVQIRINNTQVVAVEAGAVSLTQPLTINQGTITTNTAAFSSTTTWNSGGTTFTGWKLNVTDTASASASLFLDLQAGGSSRFAVNKRGHLVFNNSTLTAACNVVDITQTFNSPGNVFTLFRSSITLTASATSSIFDLTVGPSVFQVNTSGLLTHNCVLSATSTVTNMVNVVARTSGTAAAGFGLSETMSLWDAGSSVRIGSERITEWVDATAGTRKARALFRVYDTAVREALRLEASGTAAMIGFLGAAAVARATMAAATGTATRTTFDTATVTTAQLAERVKALIDDFRSYGLHG